MKGEAGSVLLEGSVPTPLLLEAAERECLRAWWCLGLGGDLVYNITGLEAGQSKKVAQIWGSSPSARPIHCFISSQQYLAAKQHPSWFTAFFTPAPPSTGRGLLGHFHLPLYFTLGFLLTLSSALPRTLLPTKPAGLCRLAAQGLDLVRPPKENPEELRVNTPPTQPSILRISPNPSIPEACAGPTLSWEIK